MITLQPEFHFRGGRDFVNTASVYEAILAGLVETGLGEADGAIRITLRRLNKAPLDVVYHPPGEAPVKPDGAVIDFSVGVGAESIQGWLLPADRAMAGRLPYDESVFDDRIRIDTDTLRFAGDSPYSAVQIATSFGRRLLQATAAPPEGRRWLCTRVDVSRPFRQDDTQDLALTLERNFNDMMTVVGVRALGERVGAFHFALGDA